MEDRIHIDGAFGEGGGQILRTSLSLSTITGRPFVMERIRLRRPQPGLRPQHLKAVEATAAICNGKVEGAAIGSTALAFTPGSVKGGRYAFDIGTAGSIPLLLQTLFYPLSFAKEPSHLTLRGGTHVRWSPCFHYLDRQWLPFLRGMGFRAGLRLVRAGFYPQGGGEVEAHIGPAAPLFPLNLQERGGFERIEGISAVANLPLAIAERQKAQAERRLEGYSTAIELQELPATASRGTMLLLLGLFEKGRCCYFSLGERGKPAERVADEAADALLAFLGGRGAIDEYLADQLLLPLALAKGVSVFCTARITSHLVTNAHVIRMFLPVGIAIDEGEGVVTVGPKAAL